MSRRILPPRWFRRVVVGPLWFAALISLLGALPLWLVGAAFASRFVPGRWRVLRVAWFLVVYLWWELVALALLFGAWVASGFGRWIRTERWQRRHYRLAAWWLRRVMGSARRTFRLVIEQSIDEEVAAARRPVLVFCRHAGPGDSFLLVDGLLNRVGRRPRIVLKDLLQLDPCVDVLLNRVPTEFVPSHGRAGDSVVDAIGRLAADMGPDDALVLFPEGGNFTPGRRERAIAKLRAAGRDELADRASGMRHVLPPKPLGALTAIEAAPGADVVFVGHVGLERLSSLRDLWRGIPLDAAVRSKLWRVAAEDVPPPDEREAWLYDRWSQLDDWIDGHVSGSATDPDLGPHRGVADDLAAVGEPVHGAPSDSADGSGAQVERADG